MQNNANVNERITSCHNINWYNVHRHIRNLRRRIFKATQDNEWKKVRSLQKLMLKSFSNVLFSVRKATQDNQGSKTAGVDKLLCGSFGIPVVDTRYGGWSGQTKSFIATNVECESLKKMVHIKKAIATSL